MTLNKALSGDQHALWKFIELAGKYNSLNSSAEERLHAEAASADEYIARELDRLAARKAARKSGG